MNKQKLILPISILLGCVVLGGFYYLSQVSKQKINNERQNIKLDNKITESLETGQENLKVETIFYISCLNGECLIPKASGLPADNQMVCLWNYTGGNASIPYLEETKGWLPSIKYTTDKPLDLSVLCRDSNGITYFGKEGEERK